MLADILEREKELDLSRHANEPATSSATARKVQPTTPTRRTAPVARAATVKAPPAAAAPSAAPVAATKPATSAAVETPLHLGITAPGGQHISIDRRGDPPYGHGSPPPPTPN
jgi:hypothetical protein